MKNKIYHYLDSELVVRDFEEILLDYDLSPEEVFLMLFENGHIDPELLRSNMDVVYE